MDASSSQGGSGSATGLALYAPGKTVVGGLGVSGGGDDPGTLPVVQP